MFYHTQRRLKYSMQDACSYPYSHIWRNQESLHTNLPHNSEINVFFKCKTYEDQKKIDHQSFQDSNRYGHVRQTFGIWQSQRRKDHKVIQEQVLKINIQLLKIELLKHIKWSTKDEELKIPAVNAWYSNKFKDSTADSSDLSFGEIVRDTNIRLTNKFRSLESRRKLVNVY